MNVNIKQNALFFWNVIDPLYYRFSRLDYVTDSNGDRTILRVRLTKYKGRDLILQDGTVIHKNDFLLKIHLHNVKLLRLIGRYDSEIQKAFITYKKVRDSLPYVLKYLDSTGYHHKIKAIIGITTLHKGCRKLGFEVYSIKNPFYKGLKKCSFYPIHLLSSGFTKRIPDPNYLIMSKDVLQEKYRVE